MFFNILLAIFQQPFIRAVKLVDLIQNKEICATDHAEGVNIINSEGIAYHQHEVLYIIKPQENARWRVMRYSPEGLMIYAALRASMICQGKRLG